MKNKKGYSQKLNSKLNRNLNKKEIKIIKRININIIMKIMFQIQRIL